MFPAGFMDKVEIQPNGCWLWQGTPHKARASDPGYGRWGQKKAHRVAWEAKNGPVPEGLHLDHFFCDTTMCVNPDHVRPVTIRENVYRGSNPSTFNLAKTHCKRGHELTPENLVKSKNGRRCLLCSRIHGAKQRQREKVA